MISIPLKRTAMGAGAFSAAVAAGFFAGTILGVPGTSGASPEQDTTTTTVDQSEIVADISDFLGGHDIDLEQELSGEDLTGIAELARLTNVLGFDLVDLASAALTSDTAGEAADSLGIGRDVAATTLSEGAEAALRTFVELGELDEATAEAAIADLDTAVEAALDVEVDIMGEEPEPAGPAVDVLEELSETHDLSALEDADEASVEAAAEAGVDAAVTAYADGTGMDDAAAAELHEVLSELLADGFAGHWD